MIVEDGSARLDRNLQKVADLRAVRLLQKTDYQLQIIKEFLLKKDPLIDNLSSRHKQQL